MRLSAIQDVLPAVRELPASREIAWACDNASAAIALRKQLYRYRMSKVSLEAVILTFCKIEVVENKVTIRYTAPPKRINT
jgi:hypothetical protein